MAAIDLIQQALEQHGCRRSGRDWTCPAHDDKRASLSVGVGADGRVLLKCHAGCSAEDVISALGLSMKDLFDATEVNPRPCVVERYDYTDEYGKLLFQVERLHPKDFRHRRPDGKGGWVYKLGDVRRVPYRLPELIAAIKAGDTIYPVEGEKDSDRLHREGWPATHANNWNDEHSAYFAKAADGEVVDVRIIADADKQGYKHAIQVRDSLRRVGIEARTFKPCAGKDISEMLDLKHSIDELVEVNLEEELGALEKEPEEVAGPVNLESILTSAGLNVKKLAAQVAPDSHMRLGTDHRLYCYHGGVYRPDGEVFARARAREVLGSKFKRRHSDEVVAWFRSQLPSVSGQSPLDKVNVKNGLLDWRTGKLGPHSPDYLSLNQIPITWKPDARCDRIHSFLLDVLPEDTLELVYEVIGYSLYAGNPMRVAVLLLGPGRNGKSVLLSIIQALLGRENVSAVPLQALSENQFVVAELYGKLANICGDLDARAIKYTDRFKMLTGGDTILAERKNRDHFPFTVTALPIFSANEAPMSSDQSDAWFDRWLILPMENRIQVEKVDPHLTRKLTVPAELEGLLVKSIQGLGQLMERGRFELPGTVEQAGQDYRERLDTVMGFVAECCSLEPDAWTKRKQLYGDYSEWVKGSGRYALGAPTFYEHLLRGHPREICVTARHGVRGFAGIRLNPQLEPGREAF